MQPIPKGDNLIAAFNELIDYINELNGQVTNFLNIQSQFNESISNHTHFENYWGLKTSINPEILIGWKKAYFQLFTQVEQGLKLNINNLNSAWKSKYVYSTGTRFINSTYHYLN
jgi:hypothetical protein